MRWESTRDSFYISCRNANFGNHRRTRKAVGIVVFAARNLVINALLFLPILNIYRPPQVLENPHYNGRLWHPLASRGLISSAFVGCAPRSPGSCLFRYAKRSEDVRSPPESPMQANKRFIIQSTAKINRRNSTRLSWLIGVQHELRSHFFVKLLWCQETQSDRRFLQRSTLSMGLLCALGHICYRTVAMSSQHRH